MLGKETVQVDAQQTCTNNKSTEKTCGYCARLYQLPLYKNSCMHSIFGGDIRITII